MNKFIKMSLALCLVTFATIGCQKDDTALNNTTLEEGAISFQGEISKVTDNYFESGDKIAVSAFESSYSQYASNVEYSYNSSSNLFTSSSPIIYSNYDQSLTFYATYPYTEADSSGVFDFEVMQDQGADSNYSLSDLLCSSVYSSQSTTPTLKFSHSLTRIVINIISSDIAVDNAKATLNAMRNVSYNYTDLSYEVSGSTQSIAMAANGVNSFKAIIPPQTILPGSILGTITLDSIAYEATLVSTKEFLPGLEYTYNMTISDGTVIFTNTTINDWDDEDTNISDCYSTVSIVDRDILTQRVYSTATSTTPPIYAADAWDGVYPTDGYGDYTTWSNFNAADSSITISTPAQLAQFAMYTVDGDNLEVFTSGNGKEFCTGLTIKLGADINLGNYPFFPLGVKFYPKADEGDWNTMTYGAFGGTFDGQGYEIQNLNLVADAHEYSDASNARLSFFNSSEAGGTYKNVTFRGVTCETTVAYNAGVLLGYTNNGISISNVNLYDAVITSTVSAGQIGGLAGSSWNYLDIIDCHIGSDVTITGTKYVGGLIGRAPLAGVIAYCTSAAKITGTTYTGGIAGAIGENSVPMNTSTQYFTQYDQMIIGCQTSGVINGTSANAGGIAGYCGTMIVGCYSNASIVTTSVKKGLILAELVEESDTYLNAYVEYGTIARQPLVYSCYAPADAESTYCIGQIKYIDYDPGETKYTWTTAVYPDPTDQENLDRSDVLAAQAVEYNLVGDVSAERKSMFVNGSYDDEEVDAMNAAIAVVTTDEGYPAFQSTSKNTTQRATLRNYKLAANSGSTSTQFPYIAVYNQ